MSHLIQQNSPVRTRGPRALHSLYSTFTCGRILVVARSAVASIVEAIAAIGQCFVLAHARRERFPVVFRPFALSRL